MSTVSSRPPADALYLDKVHDVVFTPDVTYGVGGVGYVAGKGPARYRELKLDVYRPAGDGKAPRPALILAFGGAFHRGAGAGPTAGRSRRC